MVSGVEGDECRKCPRHRALNSETENGKEADMSFGRLIIRTTTLLLAAVSFVFSALAQTAAPANQPTPPPVVVSPEVSADRQITFRLLAPQAENVRLTGSDIPGMGQGKPMTKGDKGIWELTVGPIAPGSYR